MPPGPNRNGDVFIHRVDSAARFARTIHQRTSVPLPPGFEKPAPPRFIEPSWVASPAVPSAIPPTTLMPNYVAGDCTYSNITLDRTSLSQIIATMAALGTAPQPEPDPWLRHPLVGFSALERRLDARQEFAAEYMADFVAREHDDYVDSLSAPREELGPGIRPLRGRTNALAFFDDQAFFRGMDPAIEQAPDAPIIDFILAARANPPVYKKRSVWQRLLEDV